MPLLYIKDELLKQFDRLRAWSQVAGAQIEEGGHAKRSDLYGRVHRFNPFRQLAARSARRRLVVRQYHQHIDSGWLFGAHHVSRIAGPLSVWSWVAGAVIILLIALCFAELAALFPRGGTLVHMSHASYGGGLGRIWGWMLFLAYVPVPPVEAEAIVAYPLMLSPRHPRPVSFRLPHRDRSRRREFEPGSSHPAGS